MSARAEGGNNPAPWLDLESPEFVAHPHEVISAMREQSWYARNQTGYVFFNRDDSEHVLRHRDFKYSYFHVDAEKEPYLHERTQGALLAKHGDDLRRLRTLVAIAFRHRVVESLKDVIREIADYLIDQMPDDGEVDLVQMYSRPFPAKVLGPMLGIGYDDVDGLDEWVTDSARWIDPAAQQQLAAARCKIQVRAYRRSLEEARNLPHQPAGRATQKPWRRYFQRAHRRRS